MINWFDHLYPYTNFHELNLDWLIDTITKLVQEMNDFIGINTIKYADPILWDITKQYEANTVVVDPVTGNAYISVKPVPVGVQLSRTEYWTQIYNYGNVVDTLRSQIATNERENTTASKAYSVGDLVFISGLLYRVIANMIAGDSFVVDSNVVKTTVEDEIKNEILARVNGDSALHDEIVAGLNDVNSRIDNINKRRFVMLGDSYGVTPSDSYNFATVFKSVAGLSNSDCYNISYGGMGITLDNSYYNRLVSQSDNIADHDTITDIVILGGFNDIDRGDISTASTKMAQIVTYCRTEYPNAKVWYIYAGQYRDTNPPVIKYKIDNNVDDFLYQLALGGAVITKRADSCLLPFDCVDSTDHVHPTNKGATRLGMAVYGLLYNGDFSLPKERFAITPSTTNGTITDFNSAGSTFFFDDDGLWVNLRLQSSYTTGVPFTNSQTAAFEFCDYTSNILCSYNDEFQNTLPGVGILIRVDTTWRYCECDVTFTRGKIILCNLNIFDSPATWTSGNITSIIVRGFGRLSKKYI